MAIYHCSVKTISRSAGRSATAAAAYRSGGRIVDERTAEIHDYTRKGGVLLTGIETPDGAPDWAKDRSALWNAAEAAEKRKNSTVAREVEVALPSEIDAGQMRQIVEEYSRWLSDRYGVAVDWAIHQPHHRGDERNYHAHILLTTRILGPDGLGAKCRILDDKKTGPAEVVAMRERWAKVVNRALEQAGIAERIDHRSLKEQGIGHEPQIHAGPSVTALERKAAAKDEKEPLGVLAAVGRTGGTTAVGRRLAACVDRNRKRATLERARLRHGYRRDAWDIRERWSWRQQERDRRRQQEQDRAEEEQSRQAIQKPRWGLDTVSMISDARPRKKTPWREWREQTIIDRYGKSMANRAAQEDWYLRMRPDLGGLNIVVTDPKGIRHEIVDGGDILRSEGNGIRDIPLMLDLAKAKGWTTLKIDGDETFREQAAVAALRAGFAIEDPLLEQKAQQVIQDQDQDEEPLEVLENEEATWLREDQDQDQQQGSRLDDDW